MSKIIEFEWNMTEIWLKQNKVCLQKKFETQNCMTNSMILDIFQQPIQWAFKIYPIFLNLSRIWPSYSWKTLGVFFMFTLEMNLNIRFNNARPIKLWNNHKIWNYLLWNHKHYCLQTRQGKGNNGHDWWLMCPNRTEYL